MNNNSSHNDRDPAYKKDDVSFDKEEASSNDSDEIQQPKIPVKMGFLHLLATTLAAAIGVQSSKNLEQDFSQKSPIPFIFAGIVFTVIFLLSVIFIVKIVLSN